LHATNCGYKEVKPHSVIISVGSNLGDKLANCQQGIDRLLASGKASLVNASRFYRTSPVDFLDQDWFVNAAVKIETALEPVELLDTLQSIQQQVGRLKGGIRFGPRILDLDIIFYDQLVMKTPLLEIPHPRMHKRRFVLQPICDIDPDIVHPLLNMPLKSLLNQLDDNEQAVFEI
jgi:2-amino-4-hydroxy-6-hydroxymethyldihydropteridine diphosphokinase